MEEKEAGVMGSMHNLVYYVEVIWRDECIARWPTNEIRSSDHDLGRMMPLLHSQFSYTINQRIFVALKDVRATFCAVVDEALGKRKALRFLEQVRDEFTYILLDFDQVSWTSMSRRVGFMFKSLDLFARLVEPLVGIPQKQVDIQPWELQEDDLIPTLLDSHGSSSNRISVEDFKPSAASIVEDSDPPLKAPNPIWSSSTSVEDSEPSPACKPNDCILEDVVKKYTWNHVLQMTNGSSSRQLGKGGFGTVYLGQLETGREVAVKILHRSSHQGISEFLNEVNLLRRVNHVNLVRLLGFCPDEEQVLIYEFAEEGSIWDHLHGDRKWVDWKQRLSIALQSACGLEYLHTMCNPRILHRDIKSENILLTKTMVAKVADFGSSRLGADEDNNWKTHVTTKVMGTRGYLDPEYHLTGHLRDSSDVYSFGVVLLEIITGRKPVPNQDPKCAITNWVAKTYGSGGSRAVKAVADPLFSDNYNPKALKLVISLALSCTNPSGESRPKISEVVRMLRKAQMLELGEKKSWLPFL